MLHVYLLKTSTGLEEVVKQLKTGGNAAPFIVVVREYCAFRELLQYSLLQAYKSFQQGQNKAHSLDLEWLRFLAASKNVSQALALALPKPEAPKATPAGNHKAEDFKTQGNFFCVASVEQLLPKLKKLGVAKEIKNTVTKAELKGGQKAELDEARKWLAQAHGLPEVAVKKYAAEKLVHEKIALTALD